MNTTKLNCSLDDTTSLRKLIIENPDLPLMIFCGEDSWHDEYPYERAYDYLSGWRKAYKRTVAENGLSRTEVLWMNYKQEEQMSLFDLGGEKGK